MRLVDELVIPALPGDDFELRSEPIDQEAPLVECIGMRHFNEKSCQNLDIESISTAAAQIGACVMCDMCEKRLVTQAFEDKLTGLGNLHALSFQLEKYLKEKSPILLIFMDLRNFKAVNDTIGFQQGNKMLIAAARTVESVVRGTDSINVATGRPGGDELLILMQLMKEQLDQVGNMAKIPMPPEEIPRLEVGIAKRIIQAHNQMDAFAAYNSSQGLTGKSRLGMRVGTTVIFPSEELDLLPIDAYMDRADPKTHHFAWNDLAFRD